MRKLQLYIGGERIDLFKDEAISITQTIQNVKDIDKIFTSFTKTFNLPASRTNNKVFKHYYNFDIVGGFDARLKVNATIELNDITFKKGKIKLEGVDLKNGVANTYRVTFFGNTVELKDLLGEDKLNNLPLSQYNEVYSAVDVKKALKLDSNIPGNDVIVPFITHTQRLYYKSGEHSQGSSNLWYESGGGVSHHHGVKWTDLKYALRVNKIFEAIEERYTQANGYPTNLVFSDNFIKNSSKAEIDQLFMWLHRKSGNVENLAGNVSTEQLVIEADLPYLGFTPDSYDLNITPAPGESGVYDVRVEGLAGTIYQNTGLSGYTSVDLLGLGLWDDEDEVYVYITTIEPVAFQDIELFFEWEDDGIDQEVWNTGPFTTSTDFTFDIAQQIPDMKVIDFMNGFFKMFNLTAYVNESLSNQSTTHIRIEPLDDYYASFETYDISDYVDVNKQSVNIALPYRKVNLLFKDTKTFLANRYDQLANKGWGELGYTTNEPDLDGSLYKVEVPFSHMQFERLNDANDTALTNIQYGWSVGENQSSYKGAPLLFYPNRKALSPHPISYINDIDSDGNFNDHESIGVLNVPSNSLYLDPLTSTACINYFNEINEYTRTVEFTGTLFNNYYKDYLVDTFSLKRRLTKITAYFPLKLMIKLQLNDKIVYNEKLYRINSMTTNLITGKTELELLNEV